MPHPTTLRDVVPILEDLRQLTKVPLVAKQDTILYKRIAEATSKLCSIDIENAIIESHASGEIGKVQANQARNYCAEIATRIDTFQNVFYKLDKERKNKSKADMIDGYESNHFLKEVEMFYMIAAHYEYALKACHKIPVPDDWTIDKYKQEIEQFHMADTREGWLEKKREFLKKLQESVEYDEFLLKPSFDVYHDLRNVCRKIFITVERYFPPCEIQLHPKCRETFIQKMQVHNGSYPTPEQPVKQNQTNTKSCRQWEGELFPMILVSELYEICSDVFDSTETQFHSSLNLHGKHEPIKIRPKQKIKACYLISKLYEIVPAKHKAAWREDILAHLDIQWSYYEKKYCHPRGDDASASSREYADEIDRIFKNHKKRACAKTDELILLNRFSVADLKSHVEKSEGKVTEKTMRADDTFSYWAALGASKEKVKTRAMYSSALDWFKLFRKDKPISLSAVDTAIITRFAKWLDEQKARNGTDQPLSLDTRMVILRATRAVFNQAYKDGHTTMVPNFKGLIHAGNRRRLNALTVEEVLKLWEYWLASPDKQSKYARAVGRWLLLYCLNGMNTIDMAKLVWTEKAAVSQKFPQFVFIRSKIDRANKPIGKQLDETSVPIIPQLRLLLDVYASPYSPGELVFPDIFLNAVTDEQKAIRVHDFNRRISKNIKDVCESLGILCVTPQYARNSFISALAHHGVMTAYIDYAVGHATSEVSALLAGYISNVTPAMMQAFNEKIFIVPPIQ